MCSKERVLEFFSDPAVFLFVTTQLEEPMKKTLAELLFITTVMKDIRDPQTLAECEERKKKLLDEQSDMICSFILDQPQFRARLQR